MSETWLSWLRGQSEAQICSSPEILAQAFSLELEAPQVAAIQASLAGQTAKQIVQLVERANVLNGDWPGFSQLAKSYLIWCCGVNPRNPKESFDLYARFFISLQQEFSDRRGGCLNAVIVNTVRTVVRIFGSLGDLYYEWIVGGILKLFNNIRSEREPPLLGPSKRQNAVFYANSMCRIYFALKQYVSCGNVLRNMHSMGVVMSQFPLAQQVEYRFWLGRWQLYRNEAESAAVHLLWSYEHSLPKSSQKHQALVWLVVPSILVGRLPSQEILGQLDADARRCAEVLITAIKTGVFPPDYPNFLNKDPFVLTRHLKPVIANRLPMLVYRTGLNRLIKLAGTGRQNLTLIRVAFHLNQESDPNLLITESICESLVAVGYLKGLVLPRSQVLALKSQGFIPPLVEVTGVMTSGLPEQDQWMQK